MGLELSPSQVKVVLTDKFGNGGHDLSAAPYVENMLGWHVSGRYYQIDTKRKPDRPIPLKMYFSSTDYDDLNMGLPDTSKMRAPSQLAVYAIGQLIDPNLRMEHSAISENQFRNFRNGDTLSAKNWVLEEHGNFFSATVSVNELGAGGVGSGGEGRGVRSPVSHSLSGLLLCSEFGKCRAKMDHAQGKQHACI